MRLLDANMDVHLQGVFSEPGIPCESAIDKGWRELTNGQLVSAAADTGFTCILTQDRLFAESARQTLPIAPDLTIIVVRLAQRPWREYIRQFRLAWEKQPMAPRPGSVIHWPAD